MRRTPRHKGFLTVLLAAALLAPAVAATRDVGELRRQLQESEQARAAALQDAQTAAARAQAAQAEAARLATDRVAAAARLQETETAVQQAATRMDALARQRAALQARLAQRAADFGPLLPVIERLSLYPAETLLAVPEPPEQAIRGALVVHGLATMLEEDAKSLRAAQAAVAATDAEIAQAQPALQAAQDDQQRQAAALDTQIAAARGAAQQAADEDEAVLRRAAAEAAHAVDLRGALADLGAAQRAAEARARQEQARAARTHQATSAAAHQDLALAQPAGPGPDPGGVTLVAGRRVRGWGDATAAGPSHGISFEPAPGARVTAPCSGRVVFAGPFRSYGLLLILDCGRGYHFVLAGLDRLDVELGSPVRSGEPVGVMPSWDPKTPGPRPALYVELRRGGQPIDPAPWLKDRS
jgi:septal ring factor EnvC (AmiA/AmiB activator)